MRETLEDWNDNKYINLNSNLWYMDDSALIASDEKEIAELVNRMKIAKN